MEQKRTWCQFTICIMAYLFLPIVLLAQGTSQIEINKSILVYGITTMKNPVFVYGWHSFYGAYDKHIGGFVIEQEDLDKIANKSSSFYEDSCDYELYVYQLRSVNSSTKALFVKRILPQLTNSDWKDELNWMVEGIPAQGEYSEEDRTDDFSNCLHDTVSFQYKNLYCERLRCKTFLQILVPEGVLKEDYDAMDAIWDPTPVFKEPLWGTYVKILVPLPSDDCEGCFKAYKKKKSDL